MNGIHLHQLTAQTIHFMEERLVPALSPIQKRILFIAIPLFALLGIAWALIRYWKINGVVQPPIDQKALLNKMDAQMKELLKQEEIADVKTAAWFVKTEFEEGEIERQFIFNHPDGSPLTKEECLANIDQIIKNVENAVNEDLGPQKSFQWTMFFKKAAGDYFQLSGDGTQNSQESDHTSGPELTDELIALSMALWKQPDAPLFPEGTFLKDGQFVKNAFYQNLNPVQAPVKQEDASISAAGKWVEKKGNQIKCSVSEMEKVGYTIQSFTSASCFLTIELQNKKILLQYILKNANNACFTHNDYLQKIDKIRQSLKHELSEDDALGSHPSLTWFMLLKGPEKNTWAAVRGESKEEFNAQNPDAHGERNHYSTATGIDTLQYSSIMLQQMGFPKQEIFNNQGFVPGDHYRQLDI